MNLLRAEPIKPAPPVTKTFILFPIINLKCSKDIFVTAETGCKYFEEISFPDKILAGLKIDHIGNSSIKYNIGLFKNDNINISAQGFFVHVLINQDTNKPISIPVKLKDDLKSYA